jgi:hypothetical protein
VFESKTIDGAVERLGRWTAARSTRRSFLGRAGKVGVLVASGPVVATLLAEQADARVCGQSGVSPRCATYDCGDVWGWCWYARGCCANGGLKKICDCCAFRWPNVHGYCPSGHNVKCIVESCGTDPRLQVVALHRLISDDAGAVAFSARRVRFGGGANEAVIGDVDSLWGAVAGPVAAVLGAPLFLVPRAPLAGPVITELQQLGVRSVKIAGGLLPGSVDSALTNAGFQVERVGTAPEAAAFSVQVANWLRTINGAGRTVCIEPYGASVLAATVAAGYGGATGSPLVIGIDAAKAAGVPALLVGPEATARAGEVPGSETTGSASVTGLAAELANRVLAAGVPASTIVLAPRGSPGLAGAVGLSAPIVLHEPGNLNGAREWLYEREQRGRAERCFLVGASGQLGSAGILELQSILNGYEANKLIGVSGQGLPVIPQPVEERPIGKARIAGEPQSRTTDSPEYWTARAPEG